MQLEAAKAIHKGSSISRQVQEKRQPFFRKEGEGGFFSKLNESSISFFNPNSIQPKLTIGQPNDKFEVEADAMADKVVQRLNDPNSEPISNTGASSRSLQTKSIVQKKCSHCEEKEKLQKKEEEIEGDIALQRKPIFESNTTEQTEAGIQPKLTPSIQTKCSTCELKEKLQKKEINPLKNVISVQASTANSSLEASPDLQSRLNSSKGKGSALSSSTQANMGAAFGADFDKVKVHTGSDAIQMNKALGAQAFTYGNDIYFNQGKYDTSSNTGQHLLAHELTHTIQQGSSKSIQRNTTRGAGGCGPPRAVDEDNSGAKGAGATAHRQIQSFLTPRILAELPIPRATKTNMDNRRCQRTGINLGFADLFSLGQSNVGIAEIKPIAWANRYAVPESEHYMRRGRQSMGRYSGIGSCSSRRQGNDDVEFAEERLGVDRSSPASFYKISNILLNDTIIGRFDGDNNRLLKAKLVAPGAVGYWCTGEGTNTYTCGVSQQETEEYIDRVLLPAQDLLDEFLEENIGRPLEDLINNFSINNVFSAGQGAVSGLYAQQLAIINSMLPPGVTVQMLINTLFSEIGPHVRPVIITMLRRFKSILINRLRLAIRSVLRETIRESLIALCVGVPVVTFVQLMNELKKLMKEMAERMLPELATAVLAALAVEAMAAMLGILQQIVVNTVGAILEFLGVVGEFILDILMGVLRVLAILLIAVMIIGVIVLALAALITAFDPVPGDEVALGGLAAALATLIPIVWSFVLNGPEGGPETT